MSTDTSAKHQPHVLPVSTYLGVGAALLVLTAITVWVAQFHFGEWNLIVAMAVAVLLAACVSVGLFWMLRELIGASAGLEEIQAPPRIELVRLRHDRLEVSARV